MSDRSLLNPGLAYELCSRLLEFRGFREVHVELYAEKLVEYCRGGYHDGRYWTAEEQARWVINRILDSWTQREPIAVMHQLITTNFSIDPPFSLGSKPIVLCAKCSGCGFDSSKNDRCDCPAGQELPSNLLLLFQQQSSSPTKPRRRTFAFTEEKLQAYGFKKRKLPKATPMSKAASKRVSALLDVLPEAN